MKRNPAGYMQGLKRHNRRSIERNGLMANGPAKGRMGRGKGGRLKRSSR